MIRTLVVLYIISDLIHQTFCILYIVIIMYHWFIQPAATQDNKVDQVSEDINEVTINEDGAYTVQHNIHQFVPNTIIVDTSINFSIFCHDTIIHSMSFY